MTVWEYQVLRTGIKLQFRELWTSKVKGNLTGWDLIQDMGRDGWELVSVFPVEAPEVGTNAVGWVFKRQVPEGPRPRKFDPQPIELD